MSVGCFGYNSYINYLYSSISATTEATSFEVENCIDMRQRNKWRSVGVGTQYVTIIGDSQRQIKGIAIFNHNLYDEGDTFQLQTSNDGFSTTLNTYDIAIVNDSYFVRNSSGYAEEINQYNGYYDFSGSPITAKDYRIKMISTAVSYYEIGTIYLYNDYYENNRNFLKEFIDGKEIGVNLVETNGGNIITNYNYTRHVFELKYEFTNFTQAKLITEELVCNNAIVFYPVGISGKMYLVSASSTTPVVFDYLSDTPYYLSYSQKLIEKL